MTPLAWLSLFLIAFSSLWAWWYYNSETLIGMGTYALWTPIITFAVFIVALYIIITFAGSPGAPPE